MSLQLCLNLSGPLALLLWRIRKVANDSNFVACLCRYHGKALLVTFDADNASSSHVDTITREIQMTFKRLDGEIRSMDQGTNRDEDAQVRQVQELANSSGSMAIGARGLLCQ